MRWGKFFLSLSIILLFIIISVNKANAQTLAPPASGCWWIGSTNPNEPQLPYACNQSGFGPDNRRQGSACVSGGTSTGTVCCANANAYCTGVYTNAAHNMDLWCCPNVPTLIPTSTPTPLAPTPTPIPCRMSDNDGLGYSETCIDANNSYSADCGGIYNQKNLYTCNVSTNRCTPSTTSCNPGETCVVQPNGQPVCVAPTP